MTFHKYRQVRRLRNAYCHCLSLTSALVSALPCQFVCLAPVFFSFMNVERSPFCPTLSVLELGVPSQQQIKTNPVSPISCSLGSATREPINSPINSLTDNAPNCPSSPFSVPTNTSYLCEPPALLPGARVVPPTSLSSWEASLTCPVSMPASWVALPGFRAIRRKFCASSLLFPRAYLRGPQLLPCPAFGPSTQGLLVHPCLAPVPFWGALGLFSWDTQPTCPFSLWLRPKTLLTI